MMHAAAVTAVSEHRRRRLCGGAQRIAIVVQVMSTRGRRVRAAVRPSRYLLRRDGDVSSNERLPSASSRYERESLPSSECDNNFSPAVIFYAA